METFTLGMDANADSFGALLTILFGTKVSFQSSSQSHCRGQKNPPIQTS